MDEKQAPSLYQGARTTPILEGDEFVSRGETWIVPALDLGTYKRLEPTIEELRLGTVEDRMKEHGTLEMFRKMQAVILGGLQLNYPDITPEIVDKIVTLRNIFPIYSSLLARTFPSANGRKEPAAATSGE